MPKLSIAASEAYCANHPGTGDCSGSSVGALVLEAALLAGLVFVVIMMLWWRFGNKQSDGVLNRIFIAFISRFGPSGPRRLRRRG